MVPKPALRAAFIAARVSLRVPTWLGLIRAALQVPSLAALRMRSALVTRKSSPITCTRLPTAQVKRTMPSLSPSASGSSTATMG